jgi:hypothetical protein
VLLLASLPRCLNAREQLLQEASARPTMAEAARAIGPAAWSSWRAARPAVAEGSTHRSEAETALSRVAAGSCRTGCRCARAGHGHDLRVRGYRCVRAHDDVVRRLGIVGICVGIEFLVLVVVIQHCHLKSPNSDGRARA